MSVRIATTHVWTKLFIPIIWISRIITIIMVFSLLEAILPDNDFAVVAYVIAFIATIILHALFLEQWYHILQTYLYVRINLGTKICLNEAKYFLLLFAPSDQGVWYPMTGIKDLLKNYRRQILFDSARKIYNELGYKFVKDATDYQPPDKGDVQCNTSDSEKDTSYLLSGFSDLVAMLCKMAKGDGIITKDEIYVIDNFFVNILHLSTDERKKAIDIFQQSRDTNIPFEIYAREFHSYHKDEKELLEAIVSLLTHVAFADGELSAEEEMLLNQAITIFEVAGTQYYKYKSAYNEQKAKTKVQGRAEYYAKVLGLQDEITPIKVKSAYRKLAVQYHPDKVSHLGTKIRKVAENEMKKINEAYEYFQKKYISENV